MKCRALLYGIPLLALAASTCLGADGTLIHYTFDETSGTVAHDSSGNGYDAALQNNPAWASGIVNGALHFDGSTQYGVLANSPDLSGSSFTVTAWIYREGGVGRKFVDKWDDNSGNFQFDCQVYNDSKFWFGVRQSNNTEKIAQGTTVIQSGHWYHYAAVADMAAQQLRIYVNGVQETLQADPGWDGTIHPQSMPLNIGRKVSGNDYWQGKIDDVRIYQHALTAAEIQALVPNFPPVAQPDTYRGSNVAATPIYKPGVLGNDSDPLDYALTAVLDTPPANGAVTLNADGSFSYTGNAGFTGNDTFTYHADNGHGGVSAMQTVTMQIPAVPISIASISPSSGVNQLLTGVQISGSNFYQIGIVPPGAKSFGGHFYLQPNVSLSWANARDYCIGLGGHLVTINSAAENTYVNNTFDSNTIYIGLTDEVQEGTFKWVTGEPLTYTNWNAGEPNNIGGENYAQMFNSGGGLWNDVNGNALYPFVCEFDNGQLPTVVLKKSGQPDITGANVAFVNSSTLTVDINTVGAAPGNWDVVVTNPDGQSAILPGGFVVGHSPPVAANDAYAGLAGAPLIQAAPGVLANDSQANNLALSASLVTQAAHGSVALNGDGSFTYTPNAGYAGVDSFQYAAGDGIGASAPASVTITVQGLVGWWKLDDGSGATAVDSVNAHTATLLGSPTWVPGVTGTALTFNGSTDYASIPDAPELRLPNDMTVAFWMRKQGTGTDWARMVGKGSNLVRNFGVWDQGSHGNKVLFQQYGPGNVQNTQLTSVSDIPQNKWVHIAAVINGNIAQIYVNGILDASMTRATPIVTSSDPLTFAYSGFNAPFPGSLDDIRLYNRALSASEVLALIPQAPPNVRDDSYTVPGAQPLNIPAPGVLANDSDVNGDAFTAIKLTDPAHGSVTLNADGSFTYIPTAGYDGADSFTYKANDGFGDSLSATVTLNVGGAPLPPGYVTRMLHLGASEHDQISGFPTSGQSILWDFMRFAGAGPEYIQQPSPGQTVDFHLATTNGTTLTWTDLTTADSSGTKWGQNSGTSYVMYYALYVRVPTTRQAVLGYTIDDYLKVWMDSQPTPIPTTVVDGTGVSPAFTLTAGWHAFIFKTMQNSSVDYFGVRFANPDGSNMTDLRYSTYDTVAPSVAQIVPNDGAVSVPRWNDIFISFSEPMDTTVAAGTAAALSGGSAAGSWAWTDSHTLVFTPSALLDAGATYTVTLNASALHDVAGNALSGTSVFTFTVAGNGAPPQLTSLSKNTGTPNQYVSNITAAGSGYRLGPIAHPPGSTPFQGHYYSFADASQTTSWHNAIAVCAAKSGHLATPQSLADDTFIWSFGGFTNNWIGFTDEGGTPWRWIDGQAVSYTNWSPGMPDNWGGEYYGIYWWGFGWNDVGDDPSAKRPYVCEFDQQAGPTAALVRAGFATLPAQNVRYVDGSTVLFDVNLSGAVNGAYDVVITNPDGTQAVLPGGFTVDGTPPHITAMSPAPGQTLTAAPTLITLDTDKPLDPATVNASTVRLIRAGPDGLLGTADDVVVPTGSVSLAGNQIQIALNDPFPVNDTYRVIAGAESIAGQVLRYPFNEGSGTTAADASGNGHTATLAGPAWTGGVHGAALDFNTNTSAVTIGLPDLAPPWSATLWVNRHDSPQPSSDMLISNSVYFKLEQYPNLKKVGITQLGSADYAFNYTAPVGQWVQLTFVGTSQTTSLYVNGSLQDTMNLGFNLPLAGIGASGGNSLRAVIDDFRVYNRTLNPAEVAALYASQVADLAGNPLDGFFDGTNFPSGNNGNANFSADFTLAVPVPQLSAVAPVTADQDTTAALTLTGSNLPVWTGSTGAARAVSFDGTDDSFHVPSSTLLNSSTFTIEVWEKDGFHILKRNGWPGIWEQFIVDVGAGSGVSFWVANNFQRRPLISSTVIGHEWTHVACTYDGSVQRIYINGVLDSQNTVNIPVSPYNEFMALYSDPWWSGGFSSGAMSEFRFWTVARTQAQIQSTMNTQLTAGAPNLVCRYDCSDGGPNLLDSTGNGHTGSPVDHPSFSAFRPLSPLLVRLQNSAATVYASGTLNSTASEIDCSVSLAGVPPGVYDVQLLEDGRVVAALPQSFTVTLPPRLSVTAAESLPLTFNTYTNGPAPGDKTLQLSNAGARSFDWNVSSDAAWLTVSPAGGTALTNAAGNIPLTVHADVSALITANSPYYATLTFTAPGAVNSPLTIPVTVIVAPSNQLVAWYPLDENSGSVANDLAGGGHTGALINAPPWVPGITGSALRFDGASQLIDVANVANLDFHQNDFTLAAWVNPLNVSNTMAIISRERDTDPVCQLLLSIEPGGRPSFVISDQTNTDGTYPMLAPNSIPTGQWTHLAVTRVGKTFTLYVNGYPTITKTTSTLIDHHTLYNLRIGARYAVSGTGSDCFFNGTLDDIRIYGRALDPLEVARLGGSVITDTDGNILDGEFNGDGSLSGDGVAGGDYVRTFTVSTTKLQVAQVTPAPAAALAAPPASVTVAFNKTVDPATVIAASFRLLRAGPDGQFGTADDIALTPASVTMIDALTAKLDLAGVQIPNGTYQVRLLGTSVTPVTDSNGNILDGDGDNTAGGDFVSTFSVTSPALQVTQLSFTPGSTLTQKPQSITATFNYPVDPNSLNTQSMRLVNAGPDGQFGTSDDIVVTPASATLTSPTTAVLDLSGVLVPDGPYQLRLRSGIPVITSAAAWWKFDEGSGLAFSDATGHGNSGTLTGNNSCGWGAGIHGSALTVLNTSGYALVSNGSLGSFGTGDFTVALWLKTTSLDCHVIGNRYSDNHANFWTIKLSHAGCVNFEVDQDTNGTNYWNTNGASHSVTDNAWHQIAVTRVGATLTVYVDGVFDVSTTGGGTVNLAPNGGQPVILANTPYIGAHGSEWFIGALDDTFIFNRALTPIEIQALHSSTLAGVSDLNANPLDGDADGQPGGDYVASFTLNRPKLTVTSITPTPGRALSSAPQSIVVNTSKDLDITTINSTTVTLTGSGPDGVFGTADDLVRSGVSVVTVGPRQIALNLNGIPLPNDTYQVRLSGNGIYDVDGLALDGEFDGTHLPSGDGAAGGDFASTFRIQSSPVATSGQISTSESTIVFGTLDATSASGAPLTYSIVGNGAKGTAAIVAGNQFSYTPDPGEFGIDVFTFKANDGLSDSNVATVAVAINQTFALPTLVSPATATPNPAFDGQSVLFNAAAQISTGETLLYQWDFGDGAQATGAGPEHIYAAAGSYTASVTISSLAGSIVSVVVVNVSDLSTPPGGPASPPIAFSIIKMTGSVNFAKPGHDSVKFAGVIPKVAPPFSPLSAPVTINVSGAAVTFTLDKNGHARNPGGALILQPLVKSKLHTFSGDLKFTAQLSGTFAKVWNLSAATATATAKPLTMTVAIVLNATTYLVDVPVRYSAKANSGGQFLK